MHHRFTAVATAAAAAVLTGAAASADTIVVPHVLETSGTVSTSGGTFTFDTQVFASAMVDVSGPDPAGTSTYTYLAPLNFSLTDSSGNESTLEFIVLVGGTAVEADGYRTTLSVTARWETVAGGSLNIPATSPFDLSVFGFEPEPISTNPARLAFPMPPLQFAGQDALGRDVVLSMNAGTLVIPAPAGAALFAAAGLMAASRRRRA